MPLQPKHIERGGEATKVNDFILLTRIVYTNAMCHDLTASSYLKGQGHCDHIGLQFA